MLQVSCDKRLVFPSNLQVLAKKKAEIREGSSSLPCLACMGLLLGSKEYLGGYVVMNPFQGHREGLLRVSDKMLI